MQQRVLNPSFRASIIKLLDDMKDVLRYPDDFHEEFFDTIEMEIEYGFNPDLLYRNPITGKVEHIQIFEIPTVYDRSLHLVVTPDDFMLVKHEAKKKTK